MLPKLGHFCASKCLDSDRPSAGSVSIMNLNMFCFFFLLLFLISNAFFFWLDHIIIENAELCSMSGVNFWTQLGGVFGFDSMAIIACIHYIYTNIVCMMNNMESLCMLCAFLLHGGTCFGDKHSCGLHHKLYLIALNSNLSLWYINYSCVMKPWQECVLHRGIVWK